MLFALALHHIDAALSLLDIDVNSIHEVSVSWHVGRIWSRWRVRIGNYTYSVKIERG